MIAGADIAENAVADTGGGWARRVRAVRTWCSRAYAVRLQDWKGLGIVASAALISLGAGFALRPATDVPPHSHGACVAMDMAAAYGFLDDVKRKIVTRALAHGNNPYAAHFPGGYRALTKTCATVARTRWSQP
jgi:hypothetical protein